MFCPFCHATDTKVIDSRLVSEGQQVRRRRACLKCEERFTTFETAELVMPLIIKRDGRRKSFDEEKLRQGMLKALEKRAVSVDQFESAVAEIKQALRAIGEREVSSMKLGALVMEALKRLDEVAYIRFASVYKRFKDVNEFRETINSLTQPKKKN